MPRRHAIAPKLALAIALWSVGGAYPLAAQLAVREMSLGTRPEGMVPPTLMVSAAMRLGYVVATTAGAVVVIDGVPGRLYADVDTAWRYAGGGPHLTFSPDGKRFAYPAKRSDGTVVVVVDGVEGPPFEMVRCCQYVWKPLFSPDSRHAAYVANRGGSAMVIQDGVAGPAYDAVVQLLYSSDSKHLIYHARRNGRDYVVIDGKEVAEHLSIASLVYSDSGDRLAYKVKKGDGWALVIDGVEGKTYRQIDFLRPFSRDGRRFAYVARDSLSYVVVDGVQSRGYERIHLMSCGLSEDGSHVAYAAEDHGKAFWVLDGREQKHYDRVDMYSGPPFSHNGARLTYAANQGDDWFVVSGSSEGERFWQIDERPHYTANGRVTYVAVRRGQQYVVVDSTAKGRVAEAAARRGQQYAVVDNTTFAFDQVARVYSPVRAIFSGRRGTQWYLVVDGVERAYADAVTSVDESRDGRRIAYVASREGKRFVVVDGIAGAPYDDVSQILFSPDGRHVAYRARRLDKWVAVVDGAESPVYDQIVLFPSGNQMSGDSFGALARRGREDLRVTIPWQRR